MKDKLIDGKKVVSRFRGKLVKTIRVAGKKLDELIDGKKLWVDLEVNKRKRLELLVRNLMIIQFRLKLDKFCCIGVMN